MAQPARPTEQRLRRVKPRRLARSAVNRWVFRLSGGRLGSRFLRGAPVGLLTTAGRKSGQQRTTPLIYLEDGDRVVLVASQGGFPKHPLWYLNLAEHPDVEFELPRRPRQRYRARTAGAAEKAGLWPRLCAIYPDYADYQARTDRDIPVVILDRV